MQNISVQARSNFKFRRKNLIFPVLILIGFFISRLVVFEFLNPLSIAYLGLFLGQANFYFLALSVIIGLFTKLSSINFAKYLLCVFLMGFVNIFLAQKKSLFLKSMTSFLCMICAGIIISFFNWTSNFILLINFIESVLIFFLLYVFYPAYKFLSGKSNILINDELISFAIILGSAIAGMTDIYVGDISVLNICSIFILLTIGNNYGSSYSSMFGLILGIILNAGGFISFNEVVIFAMAGVFAGAFKNHRKLYNIIVLFSAGPLIVLYAKPSLLNKNLFISTFISAIIFLVAPIDFSAEKIKTEDEYLTCIKNIVNYRLRSFADSFKKLSATFNNLAEKKLSLDRKDISKLIDNIAAKSCNNCSMKTFCWENNFYDTYQTVFSILSACEKKGSVDINDIPSVFRLNCVSLGRFVDNTNKLFEIYKINLAWNNKIIESRELVSQQLFGVSTIINNLADELNLEMRFDNETEEKISSSLIKNNIDFESLSAIKNKDDKHEVVINLKSCGNQKICCKKILPILNNTLEKNMYPQNDCCISDHGLCNLKFVEKQRFFVNTGVSRSIKKNSSESGDCYSIMQLKNNQFALVLSDGMGSGNSAKIESKATVELFEDFMESGFDKNTAMRMINSILVLKSNDDSFSTLDVCFIDLFNGSGEFIKTGASTSFLFRDGFLQSIKSSSLPIGILNDLDFEFFTKKFRDGDIIIMMTDGVFDTIQNISDKKQWLLNLLLTLNSNNPQDIADYIMQKAKHEGENVIKDDMTILVGRVWEKI